MKSQREQIKAAKRAYLIKLNASYNSLTSRYAVYLDTGEGLSALWPSGIDNKDLLPRQIYYKQHNEKFPAYHFTVSGIGLNHFEEVKEVLTHINPGIEVFSLNGWAPTIRG